MNTICSLPHKNGYERWETGEAFAEGLQMASVLPSLTLGRLQAKKAKQQKQNDNQSDDKDDVDDEVAIDDSIQNEQNSNKEEQCQQVSFAFGGVSSQGVGSARALDSESSYRDNKKIVSIDLPQNSLSGVLGGGSIIGGGRIQIYLGVVVALIINDKNQIINIDQSKKVLMTCFIDPEFALKKSTASTTCIESSIATSSSTSSLSSDQLSFSFYYFAFFAYNRPNVSDGIEGRTDALVSGFESKSNI
ncbi:MAG: hypothetical protein EZS28_029422 [Streblomastix strix]|uniref:Uncharacterized protein n=1 Tax=Streblomastix strix TaxID=222440 RepID=A0A5J4UYT6_9EUKA|nr:MAG: hypothetical protein EZS28_029422 [Streblomastix strix]